MPLTTISRSSSKENRKRLGTSTTNKTLRKTSRMTRTKKQAPTILMAGTTTSMRLVLSDSANEQLNALQKELAEIATCSLKLNDATNKFVYVSAMLFMTQRTLFLASHGPVPTNAWFSILLRNGARRRYWSGSSFSGA